MSIQLSGARTKNSIVEKFSELVSKIPCGGNVCIFCTPNYMCPIFIIAGSHEQMKEVELKSLESGGDQPRSSTADMETVECTVR